ncbi:MAG: twin-arginine translocase subunit TatB, partial [Desulfovibrio sp.]|nr:twin-arginine translocase subunit TatB [Desulfovibrio sp.]
MFGIGSTELLVILLVALIVLGPKSLAKVSRSLGKAMGEFRRVSTDFQRTLNAESAEADLREQEAARRRKEAAGPAAAEKTAPAQPAPAAATAADEADSLTAPEGSPLAEALARARAEAEAATAAA